MSREQVRDRAEQSPERIAHTRRCERAADGFEVDFAVTRPMSSREQLRIAAIVCAAGLVYVFVMIGIAVLLPTTAAVVWCVSAFAAGIVCIGAWLRKVSLKVVAVGAHGHLITIDDETFALDHFGSFEVLGRYTVEGGDRESPVSVEIARIGYVADGQPHELGTLRADVAVRVVTGLNQWIVAAAPERVPSGTRNRIPDSVADATI